MPQEITDQHGNVYVLNDSGLVIPMHRLNVDGSVPTVASEIGTPGSDARAAVEGATRATGRGNRTIGFGDSLTAGNMSTASGVLNYANTSYFDWATLLSENQIRYQRNAGVGGDTVAEMLARVDDDVIAYAPDRCLILGGTNDLASIDSGATTVSAVITDYETILDALQAAGIEPIMVTLPPRASYQDECDQFNIALTDLADRRGHVLVDGYSVLVDPTTRAQQASYTTDGVHFTIAGAQALGQSVANQLANHYTPNKPYVTKSAADSINLLTNGTMTTDATADGKADSWSFGGSGGTVAYALVEDAAAVVGKWQEVAVTATTQRNMSQTLSGSRWAVGDRLAFSGIIEAESVASGFYTLARLTFSGTSVRLTPVNAITTNFGPVRFYGEMVVPSGTTSIFAEVTCNAAGTGTYRAGQMTVLNLTALGII